MPLLSAQVSLDDSRAQKYSPYPGGLSTARPPPLRSGIKLCLTSANLETLPQPRGGFGSVLDFFLWRDAAN
jgi:hypothetical protein